MRLVKLRWGVVFLGTTLCTYSRLGVFELENQSLTPLTKLPINSTVFSPKLFFIRASQSVPHKVRERGYLIFVFLVIPPRPISTAWSILWRRSCIRRRMRSGATDSTPCSSSYWSSCTADGAKL